MYQSVDYCLVAFIKNTLDRIREERFPAKKKRRFTSILEPYRYEVLQLASLGINSVELHFWLKTYKNIRVTPSNIRYRMKYWNSNHAGEIDPILAQQLDVVRELIKSRKIKRCRRSRLDPHKKNIMKLIKQGANFNEVVYWLNLEQGITISSIAVANKVRIWKKDTHI
ncbi:MAG: hypothetical protein JKY50_19400 [Oleispira sp.]|nr:hypothetical protein [Oleispira sp.]